MATQLLDPPQPSSMTTPQGKISTPFYTWLRSIKDNVADTITGLGSVQSQQEVFDFAVGSPDNEDYPFEINAPFGYTITQVDAICEAGSCTLTIKIGGTALGGGSNSVTTTLSTVMHSSSNVIAAGGTSVFTVSSNSSCDRLRVVVWYTRT